LCNINKNKGFLLIYINNSIFKKIKQKIKNEIFYLKNRNLFFIIKKVNNILKIFLNYYKFTNNNSRLNYLRHFIDRCYWRQLTEKYRIKGQRRTKWIANTFFLTKKSPYKNTWHLHKKINLKKCQSKKKNYILWSIIPTLYCRSYPIQIMKIPNDLIYLNYYLNKQKFFNFQYTIWKKRKLLKPVQIFL
jgi:hypothetical protein